MFISRQIKANQLKDKHTVGTIYMAGRQNTTNFIALYYTICYTTTCFGPFLDHRQVVSA